MAEEELKLAQLLKRHVPEPAVAYCVSLWEKHPFHFKITRKRTTKQGDYRYDPRRNSHRISVNGDLNPYSFLITYIHEYAHLINREQSSGRRALPHGREWRHAFKLLMMPLLTEQVFPRDVLRPLNRHMRKPRASTHTDPHLVAALRRYDDHGGLIALGELPDGSKFVLGGRVFKKEKTRRTRVLCVQIGTSRKYLVPRLALVAVQETDRSVNISG